jgi:hypothetical protein
VHFPSEKNAFLFLRGNISARSRRVGRDFRVGRRDPPGGADPKIFLQNG